MMQVTERALFSRIDRALRREDPLQRLRKMRGEAAIRELGWICIWDYSMNIPMSWHLDLETLGRDLGVLRPDETVIE
jgi:hypothetical protein